MHLTHRVARPVLLALMLAVVLAGCADPSTPVPTALPPIPTGETPQSAPDLSATDPALASPPSPTPTTALVSTPTPTATPTVAAAPAATEQPTTASRCERLSGQLEIQVLVGPAEAVGLEPVAVGSVPFAVTGLGQPYPITGQAPVSYEATLTQAWGTYTVTMDLDVSVQGECSGAPGNERLDLVLEMTGEQLVVVDAEGMYGEYPWSGTHTRKVSFPLEDGAQAEGEGWIIVLHLSES